MHVSGIQILPCSAFSVLLSAPRHDIPATSSTAVPATANASHHQPPGVSAAAAAAAAASVRKYATGKNGGPVHRKAYGEHGDSSTGSRPPQCRSVINVRRLDVCSRCQIGSAFDVCAHVQASARSHTCHASFIVEQSRGGTVQSRPYKWHSIKQGRRRPMHLRVRDWNADRQLKCVSGGEGRKRPSQRATDTFCDRFSSNMSMAFGALTH